MVSPKLFLGLVFLLMGNYSFAQADEANTKKINNNVFKINVAALGVSTVNVQYEKRIGNRTTVAIGFYKRFEKSIYNYLDRRDETPFDAIRLSSIGITPEVKYYFWDKEFSGLYVGTFARWRKDDLQFNYSALGISTFDKASFQLEDNVLNVGIMLGYQLQLHKNIYVDFWLVGLGLRRSSITGSAKSNFDSSAPHSYSQMYNILEGVYNTDFSYRFTDYESSFAGESWRVSFRGVGVCLGIGF